MFVCKQIFQYIIGKTSNQNTPTIPILYLGIFSINKQIIVNKLLKKKNFIVVHLQNYFMNYFLSIDTNVCIMYLGISE